MSNGKINYDLELCGSLPIQHINLIQPYGVLIVVERSSGKIIQVSENAASVFKVSFQKIINTKLDEYVDEESFSLLNKRISTETNEKIPSLWRIQDSAYITIVHPHPKYYLVEIDLLEYEKEKQQSFATVYQEIKFTMGLIQGATSIEEISVIAARELKRISGFDKVMIYRFDTEWNGTVLAEEKEPAMESYSGFTFPASDIPRQARLLYLKNPYRFIPTRIYTPIRLYPVINPITQSFLDLSDCNLRGVPSVHLEYLKNMKVIASMSTRILSGDNLWGLIACHHQEEKMVSFEMRSIFEMISNIVSTKIHSLEVNAAYKIVHKLNENYKQIVEGAYKTGNLVHSLFNGGNNLLQLFNATGAVFSYHGKTFTDGIIPEYEKIRELFLWLHTRQLTSVFAIDCLSSVYEQAADFKAVASGILVIPVNPDTDDYVIIMRPEKVQVINWGGNPDERIRIDQDRHNYHPRNSFENWQQQVNGTSHPWSRDELVVAENLRSFIFEFSSKKVPDRL